MITWMPNLTLRLPEDLHRRMKRHPGVDWSEVVRRIIAAKIRDFGKMDRLAQKSPLTGDNVDDLDHLVKASVSRRYRKSRKG